MIRDDRIKKDNNNNNNNKKKKKEETRIVEDYGKRIEEFMRS